MCLSDTCYSSLNFYKFIDNDFFIWLVSLWIFVIFILKSVDRFFSTGAIYISLKVDVWICFYIIMISIEYYGGNIAVQRHPILL